MKKGFTLIEILLSLGIFSIAVFVISTFYFASINARVKGQTIMDIETEANQALTYITQKIRNASLITSPSQGNSAAILTLTPQEISENPTIVTISEGAIVISEGFAAPVPLTSSSTMIVTNLLFENLSRDNSPGTIRISFTAEHVNSSGRNEYEYSETYHTSASLRPR